MTDTTDPILEQVAAEILRSAGAALDDIPDSMKARIVANVLGRMSALSQGQTATANLLHSTIALDLVTAGKIGAAEARRLILRITKIAASAATLIPGFIGVAVGALSALIPEPKDDSNVRD